jgi:pimeloyl-ACP methyl ester carboxylesterase
MPSIDINGGTVVYEILGTSGPLSVLTPGGRYGSTVRGLRPLADALVAGGHRVLLWDRPNCGRSAVQFYGASESHMRAETLHGLLTVLAEPPCMLVGGSGGARDSIVTAIRYPELVAKLAVWDIVGGVYGQFNIGAHYLLPSIRALRTTGIDGLLEVPEWRERIAENPKNRERLLAMDRHELTALMLRWLNAYVPKPGQTIPGVEDELFSGIRVPTLIIRGGENDLNHPRRTSLEVHCLIRGSVLIDPPWPEDAWEANAAARARGEDRHPFDVWVQAAPAILGFAAERAWEPTWN